MNIIIDRIKNDTIIQLVQRQCFDTELDVYLVGGAPRDFLLGSPNFDKDLIVAGAEIFAQNLARSLDAKFLELDDENKIYRVILNDKINYIDVAEPFGGDLFTDLQRRDLSINSIAINLKTLEIIDINNGINDLKNRKIRHVLEKNITDDPLRILRAFRFKSILGFELDDGLEQIIKKNARLTLDPAMERVSAELLKIFGGGFCAETLVKMDELGVLAEVFPFVKELKKVPANSHHHLGLFEHSVETVKQVEKIYLDNENIKSALDKNEGRIAYLKLAAFLHDIGKPATWTIDEGKHRFIKHDDVGSKLALSLLKSFKLSKKQIGYIIKMIKYHIYPSNVVACDNPNDKVFMRFVRKIEFDGVDVITLAMADRYSARGIEITDEVIEKNISGLQNLLEFYIEAQKTIKPLPKLLDGLEVMELLALTPSKELGMMMKLLKEAQISGEVLTKEDAIEFVKKKYTKTFA